MTSYRRACNILGVILMCFKPDASSKISRTINDVYCFMYLLISVLNECTDHFNIIVGGSIYSLFNIRYVIKMTIILKMNE